MKIVLDLTALADNFTGIERYAASIAREMVLISQEDRFILVFKECVHPFFEQLIKRRNVRAAVLPRRNKLFFNQITLPLFLQRVKADWYLFMAFPVPVLLFKKHMISTIHDLCAWDCPETMNGLSTIYFRASHRIAMLKCFRILTISEFSKKRIVDKLKYDESKIWTIYCGLDERFRTATYSKGEQNAIRTKYCLPDEYILSLSTLEPRKNLQLLIRAYTMLVEDGVVLPPLVLAGRRGWIRDELYTGMPDSVKNRIRFTGFVDEEDLPFLYRAARLFVFPSLYEGFGIPPLEALASGTRVLSSDAASLPEVLGGDVMYFKSDDVFDLKYKLQQCIDNEEAAIQDTRSELFSWRREAYQLLDKLRGVYN